MTATNNGRAELSLPPEVITCLKAAFAAKQEVEITEAAKDSAETAYELVSRQQKAAAEAHRSAKADLKQARQDLLTANRANADDRWDAYQASLAAEAEARTRYDQLQQQLAQARKDRDQTRQAFKRAEKALKKAEDDIDQTSRRLTPVG